MIFITKRIFAKLLLGLALCTGLDEVAAGPVTLSPEEIYALARDAYLYAYPIVTMEATMRQATNVPDATTVELRAPINQFAHARAYPKAGQKDVVRLNFDTLYSAAWVDVRTDAAILSVPDTGGRYYLLPMLDMWSDVFAVVGSRTTGTKPGNYAIVPPEWSGSLPPDVVVIVAPTPLVWILGRTKTDGPADYAEVHKVQEGFKLTPLSQWGTSYVPPKSLPTDPSVDSTTPPSLQVEKIDGVGMLTRLAELLVKYPTHTNDNPILLRLRALGIEVGKPFDGAKLDPKMAAIIDRAAKDAQDSMRVAMTKIGDQIDGWTIARETIGTYGTSYLRRASVAMGGLGANLPEDAVYPVAFADESGKPLNGESRYVLHFEKGKLPPADAFWSITMYDKNGFQVPNPIDRYALGSKDELAYDADGSLDIYVQAVSPGKDKERNWLPAPKGEFQPTMRLYSPRREVLDGAWAPPPFVKVN
jgi:hypothetical protein